MTVEHYGSREHKCLSEVIMYLLKVSSPDTELLLLTGYIERDVLQRVEQQFQFPN